MYVISANAFYSVTYFGFSESFFNYSRILTVFIDLVFFLNYFYSNSNSLSSYYISLIDFIDFGFTIVGFLWLLLPEFDEFNENCPVLLKN